MTGLIWLLWSASGHPSGRWRSVFNRTLRGLSLSNTVELLDALGVDRSRKAIHDRIQKADLQPELGQSPNQVSLDETVIRINDQQFWLYAAADPQTNDLLYSSSFQRPRQLSPEPFPANCDKNTISRLSPFD
jgi:hypothetical protein